MRERGRDWIAFSLLSKEEEEEEARATSLSLFFSLCFPPHLAPPSFLSFFLSLFLASLFLSAKNITKQYLPLRHAGRRRGHLRRPGQPRRDARRRARRRAVDGRAAGWRGARGVLLSLLRDLGREFFFLDGGWCFVCFVRFFFCFSRKEEAKKSF